MNERNIVKILDKALWPAIRRCRCLGKNYPSKAIEMWLRILSLEYLHINKSEEHLVELQNIAFDLTEAEHELKRDFKDVALLRLYFGFEWLLTYKRRSK